MGDGNGEFSIGIGYVIWCIWEVYNVQGLHLIVWCSNMNDIHMFITYDLWKVLSTCMVNGKQQV